MTEKTSKPTKAKKDVVFRLVKLFKEYQIVAIVNMENLPAKQLQNMRQQLRSSVEMVMTKRRLMKLAIDKAKTERAGIEKIIPHLKGMPALMFTKENPFKLYKKIQQNKSSAPAKAGQTAPKDIKVSAGPTSFAPGPIISELSSCGIKAGIDAGKVVIKQDSVVVKEGQLINAKMASVLARLGIEPMEIGLNITAVFENGAIFSADILSVDEKEYIRNLTKAATWAINLCVEAGITNKDVIEVMIAKAFRDSKAIAVSQGILADKVIGDVLARAECQAGSLKSTAGI